MSAENTLKHLIHNELAKPQSDAVIAAARHAANPYGSAVIGVLFYGSCLRTGELDDKILDFYVIVDSYAHAYEKRWLAMANGLLPPNVFYDECHVHGRVLRTKYNIVSLDDLEKRTAPDCLNVSLWARLSQPLALLLPKDEDAVDRIAAAVAQAVKTMLGAALPLCNKADNPQAIWSRALGLTYSAELRSEPPGKGHEIYSLDAARYDKLTAPALAELGIETYNDEAGLVRLADAPSPAAVKTARRQWVKRRFNGKIVSFLRLIKASLTFDGGIDYLAWKIERHSGVKITITPWQRRHPVLAGLLHFYRLRRQGAFR